MKSGPAAAGAGVSSYLWPGCVRPAAQFSPEQIGKYAESFPITTVECSNIPESERSSFGRLAHVARMSLRGQPLDVREGSAGDHHADAHRAYGRRAHALLVHLPTPRISVC